MYSHFSFVVVVSVSAVAPESQFIQDFLFIKDDDEDDEDITELWMIDAKCVCMNVDKKNECGLWYIRLFFGKYKHFLLITRLMKQIWCLSSLVIPKTSFFLLALPQHLHTRDYQSEHALV